MKKYYDVCVKETYESQGQQKVKWHQVGKLMETDKSGIFRIKPPLSKLFVFEQKAKNEAHQTAAKASSDFQDDELPPF